MPIDVGVGDMIPSVTVLEEATGDTSSLDDTATGLDTGVDSSPEAVAMEDKTPALDTVANIDWLVVFWEAMTLSPTTVVMEDSTPTPTEGCEEAVADGDKPDVFTAETVSLRLGVSEGKTADESATALVWLASPVELANGENG